MSMMPPAQGPALTPDLGGLTPEQAAGQHMDQMFDGKMPPDQANYRPSTPGGPRCDQCVNFIPPDQCQVVAGKISPDGVSDQFQDQNQAPMAPPPPADAGGALPPGLPPGGPPP